MAIPLDAEAVLDRYFLEMRCRVLDVAAALDRVERADGFPHVASDERLTKLREAIAVLTDGKPDRAARIQMIFSDPYEPAWPRPANPWAR